jgi:glycerol kinase
MGAMGERYVAAVDQGTGSSRCLVFDRSARLVSMAQKEHRPIFPRPGWVEADPEEIWANVGEVVSGALRDAGLHARDLMAVGIANQRESTVVWERDTGRAVHNLISWQDTRTARDPSVLRGLRRGELRTAEWRPRGGGAR